jgi:NAD(P)H-dependent flavin oxidoreductase YrpB (nitropropane dioxygenase family)
VGTRFVAAEEAEAHPEYVRALIAARPQDTVYTDAFSGGWPDAPHRVLRSSIEAAAAFPSETIGEYVDRYTGEREPIGRFEVLSVHQGVTGSITAMPLWAGESVGGVRSVQPAAAIVRELTDGAEALLQRWAPPPA